MDHPTEKGSGFEGQHHLMLPERLITAASRHKPLLRALMVAGAGYFPKADGHLRRRPTGINQAILIYCVKGNGWCETGGKHHPLHAGDLVVLPPATPHAYGADSAQPWTIHWIHFVGGQTGEYLKELSVSPQAPLLRIGEDLQVVLLFNEVLKTLESGLSFLHLLRASQALAHLLALLIQHRHEQNPDTSNPAQKVAQAIVYMSEHLEQPLRVSALAALVNLSPAHFTVLFKDQTGCSPKEYLNFLRIHRACQLLQGSNLSIKVIAAQLGYQDQFHFSRQFKAFQGVSPTEYRASGMA